MNDKQIKILVIDDEEEMSKAIAKYLSEYQIVTAGNGKEGLELVKAENPDLIISDIVMPEMEGIEFITKLNKSRKHIPVIMMSGNEIGKKYLNAANLLGAAVVIEKPFDFETLRRHVKRILNKNAKNNIF